MRCVPLHCNAVGSSSARQYAGGAPAGGRRAGADGAVRTGLRAGPQLVLEPDCLRGDDATMRLGSCSLLFLLASCALPPKPWSPDVDAVVASGRPDERETVVFLALPGREQSDRMEKEVLRNSAVELALDAGRFRTARVDAFARQDLYAAWVGSGEGMGIAVLDTKGQCYAARPGPQDPPELEAFLRLCASRRQALVVAQGLLEARPFDPDAMIRLAEIFLELGARVRAEPLLLAAAEERPLRVAPLMALLHGQDGRLQAARKWLERAPAGPERDVVDGYLCFKERRHEEAIALLRGALEQPLPDRENLRARLYLGKSLQENGQSDEALRVLRSLLAEARGTVFAGAAEHTIEHIKNPNQGHTH